MTLYRCHFANVIRLQTGNVAFGENVNGVTNVAIVPLIVRAKCQLYCRAVCHSDGTSFRQIVGGILNVDYELCMCKRDNKSAKSL